MTVWRSAESRKKIRDRSRPVAFLSSPRKSSRRLLRLFHCNDRLTKIHLLHMELRIKDHVAGQRRQTLPGCSRSTGKAQIRKLHLVSSFTGQTLHLSDRVLCPVKKDE